MFFEFETFTKLINDQTFNGDLHLVLLQTSANSLEWDPIPNDCEAIMPRLCNLAENL